MTQRLGSSLGFMALALALAGCSGSEGTLAPDQSNSATVTAVMRSVVLPMVGGMADLNAESTASPPPGGGDGCTDFSNVCLNGGTAQMCTDTADADIAWSYEGCERQHGLVDGTVAFNGNLFSTGTTIFDIAIGDLTLAGSVGWEWQNLFCRERTYDGFSAASSDHSTSIDGHVRFCQGNREGQLDLYVVKPNATFSLSLDFDAQTGTATLHNPDGTFTCTIHMGNGEADCQES